MPSNWVSTARNYVQVGESHVTDSKLCIFHQYFFVQYRRRGSLDEFPSGEQPEREIYSEQRFGEYSSVSKIGILRIEKVHRSDDGLYECIARNTGGTASAVGHIVVEYPPTIENTKSLPLVYTWNQQTANLSCSAEGKSEEESEHLK